MTRPPIICVDFDGTCVDHRYPDIGQDVPGAVEVLWNLSNAEAKIILWTCRSGIELEQAVKWFEGKGIKLFGVNENPQQKSWSTSPKAYANFYIDDAALGAPLREIAGFARKCVDWDAIRTLLVQRGDLEG